MEIFQNLISTPPNASEKEVEDNITTLVDRLAHSTLVSDRRGAILAMKSFSRQYREIVIAKGVKQLFATLKQDSYDADIVKAILETLLILFIRGESDSDLTRDWINSQSRVKNGKYPSPSILVQNIKPDQFSLWIADELTQSTENLELLIETLEFDDVHIRIYALQLLQALVSTRRKRTQELVLQSPTAISKLCTTLDDLFEPIRNEAILLLMGLVKDNFNIQKLVVFENTFDKLYRIIEEEGGINGTIVVQDCLSLIANLLNYNSSNQKFFIETNCLKQLVFLINQCLDFGNGFTWITQRSDNLITTLDTCRLFVVKDTQDIRGSQDAMVESGAMLSCLKLVFSLNVPNEIRVVALMTVSDIIRGNNEAQFRFSQVDVPYIDPSLPNSAQKIDDIVPINVALLNWCLHLNSVHCFDIRAAAAYTLHSFFKDNNEAKVAFLDDQIYAFNFLNGIGEENSNTETVDEKSKKDDAIINKISSVIDSLDESRTSDSESIDSGAETESTSIDLHGLEAKVNIFQTLVEVENYKINPYKIWFASVILLYIMEDYLEMKEKILAINLGQVEDEDEEDTIYFLPAIAQALCTSLKQSDVRVPIAYLMLLTYICWESYEAVDEFLKDPSVIDQLLAYIVDPVNDSALPQGLISFYLSEVYEFTRATSPLSRVQLQSLLSKRVGIHSLSLKIQQILKNSCISNFDELDWLKPSRDESGLPEVYFEEIFVSLMKENSLRITRAIGVNPNILPVKKLNYSSFEAVQIQLREISLEYEKFKLDTKEISDRQMKQLAESASDFNQLTERHEKLMSELQDVTSQRDDVVEKLSQSVAEVEKLTENQASLEAKITELSEELKKTSSKLKKSEADCASYKEKFENVDKAKTTAENGINKMSRELMNLTSEKAKNEKKISTLEKEISNLKKSLENTKKEVASLTTKNTDLISNYESRVESLSLELNNAKKEISQLLPSIAEKDKKIANLENNASDLVSKLRSAASIIEDLKNQKNQSNNEYTQYKENVTNEIKDLKSTLLELQKVKAALEDEKVQFNRKQEKLKEELTSAFEDFTHLQEETSKEIKTLNETVSSLKQQYEESKTINQQLEEDKLNLKTTIENLKSENEKNSEVCQAKVKDLEAKSNSKIHDLQAKLDVSDNEVQKLRKEIEALESNLSEVDSNTKVSDETIKKLEKEKDEALKTIDRLENEKQSILKKFENNKMENKSAIDQKMSQIANLEQQLKNKDSEIERLSQQSTIAEGNQDTTIRELSGNITSLKQELQQLETYKTDAEGKITVLNQKINEVNEMNSKLKSDVKKALEEKDRETQSLEAVVADLKDQIEKLVLKEKKAAQDASDSINAKQETLNDVKKKLDEQIDFNDQLKSKLEQATSSIDKMKQSNEDSVSSLKKTLDSKEEVILDLKRQIQTLENSIDDLKSENLSFKSETEKLKEKEEELKKLLKINSELSNEVEAEKKKNEQLQHEAKELKSSNDEKAKEASKLRETVSTITAERDSLNAKLAEASATKSAVEENDTAIQSRLDELLLLWTEATEKAASYKERLVALGEEVESDEEDDEDDEDEDDDDDEDEE